MLHQHQVMRQHASELVDVGRRSESSQPVTVHSDGAGVAGMLHDSQWYDHASLYIKCGKVSMMYVRTSVTVGVASSVANDVTMRMTS